MPVECLMTGTLPRCDPVRCGISINVPRALLKLPFVVIGFVRVLTRRVFPEGASTP